MIYCPNCGKGIADDSKFCIHCGTAISPVTPKIENSEPTRVGMVESSSVIALTATKSATAGNAFYANIGFWGAVILFAGFFLPFYRSAELGDVSLSQMYGYTGEKSAGIYLLLLLPLCSGVLIIQGLIHLFPPVVANICKVLPLLLLVFCSGAVLRENESTGAVSELFRVGGPGFYITLLGCLLILFFKNKKR